MYFIYDKNNLEVSSYEQQLKLKIELIKPKPKMFNKYPELIELYYNIRELYDYNQEAFSQSIEYVDNMLMIYNDLQIGLIYDCSKNVEVAVNNKDMAISNLRSIIYQLENNKILERKLTNAANTLNQILNNYEEHMLNICREQIKKEGYDNRKTNLPDGKISGVSKYSHNI
jgi:hypothetical protein